MGPLVPEAQPFQGPLPDPPVVDGVQVHPGWSGVIHSVRELLSENPDNIPNFVRLAWRCAATHRVSDYAGGCNGARIRTSPQKDWPINAGLDKVLECLKPVKEKYEGTLSWADLIVLAGTLALQEAGAPEMKFCGGRVDSDTTKPDPVSGILEYMNREAIVSGNIMAK